MKLGKMIILGHIINIARGGALNITYQIKVDGLSASFCKTLLTIDIL